MQRFLQALLVLSLTVSLSAETLNSLTEVPQSVEALWGGYDPRVEPLDVEILHEWEEDGVVMQVVRYRVGIFKGQKAMVAAVYGYPKGAADLPGLLQIHGGGQYADYKAVLTNAKRGYATLSLAWAGRLNAKDYLVSPKQVELFFASKTEDSGYKLTTDWGALEGYHAPSRVKSSNVMNLKPAEWTIDSVESPRNSTWYLWTMAARRGLTFLEQQPQVDAHRLGVYGHSMGGKLTVLTAGSDSRVKVAAPSCGGVSHRNKDPLHDATIGDAPYLERITCPIFFLSPANDFHGQLHHVPVALEEIRTDEWRITSAPHHNHQDTAPYEVATQLWMDQHLKGGPSVPQTPELSLNLETPSGVPAVKVMIDGSIANATVEVYYTQQGHETGKESDMDKVIHRHWHPAEVFEKDGCWWAELPVASTDEPLWVYANAVYPLAEPIIGAGYYYRVYTANEFVVSTPVTMVSAADLKSAEVRATLQPTNVIEDFEGNWKQAWFSYKHSADDWKRTTHKLYDPLHSAPEYAKLALQVRSEEPNTFAIIINGGAAEIELKGGEQWQEVVLYPSDFKTVNGAWADNWTGAKELRFTNYEQLRSSRPDVASLKVGKPNWQGSAPEFKNLRWVPGTRAEYDALKPNQLLDQPVEDGKVYLNIDAADQVTDGYQTVLNTWFKGEPLILNGATYARGLTTHAPAEIVYFLGGKFDRFKATALAGNLPMVSVQCEVYLDGTLVFDSGVLNTSESAPVDLDVKGVSSMRLVLADGGDGATGDHASWVDAHLTRP